MKSAEILQIFITPDYFRVCSILFALIGVLVITFSFVYLHMDKIRIGRQKDMMADFSTVISGIILCSSEQDLAAELQKMAGHLSFRRLTVTPTQRRQLIRELTKLHRSLSGTAAENVKKIYLHFGLHNDTLAQIKSRHWHVKATAIQQISHMGQTKYITKIYKSINHPNPRIRLEAQLALVRLTGFDGLRFLSVSNYPLSVWQQLGLLKELSLHAEFDVQRIRSWLHSKNNTTVEFTLKLIQQYQCYELHDEVIDCLYHSSVLINRQALISLRELQQPGTAAALLKCYVNCKNEMQVPVLQLLKELETCEKEKEAV